MAIPRNLGNLAQGADTNGVLGVTKGGTGATSSAAAPFALKGANADITSLTGLTTALSVAQGGTGAATLTANNVLLGNGTSALQAVAPGTNGNVLTSNGTTWSSTALPAAGAFTLISTQTASGAASITFTGLSTYNQYMIVFQNIVPGSTSTQLNMQVGTGGGPTYITSNYLQSGVFTDSYGTNPVTYDVSGGNQFTLSASTSITTGALQGTSGFAIISGCVSNYLQITGQISVANVIARNGAYSFTGLQASSQTITAIRVLFGTGTITGKISLYGLSS
jgi:hypothetical protein